MKDEDGRQEQVIRSHYWTERHRKSQLSINFNSLKLKELYFRLVILFSFYAFKAAFKVALKCCLKLLEHK